MAGGVAVDKLQEDGVDAEFGSTSNESPDAEVLDKFFSEFLPDKTVGANEEHQLARFHHKICYMREKEAVA